MKTPGLLSPHRMLFFLLAGILLAFLVPVLLGGTASFRKVIEVPAEQLALLMLLMVIIWILNVARLKLLLYKPLSELRWLTLMRIYMAIEFSSKCTPLGSAAPATAYILLKPHGITFGEGMAIFTIAALMDAITLLFLVAVLLGVGSYHHQESGTPSVILILVALAFLFIIGSSLLYRYHHRIIIASENLLSRQKILSVTSRKKIRNLVLKYRQVIRRVLSLPLRKLIASSIICLIYWILYLSTLAAAAAVFFVDMAWFEAAFIQIAAMTGGHLLMTPGGSGGAEAVGILMLGNLTSPENATATILLWRFLMFHLYIITGAVCFLWSLRKMKTVISDN